MKFNFKGKEVGGVRGVIYTMLSRFGNGEWRRTEFNYESFVIFRLIVD